MTIDEYTVIPLFLEMSIEGAASPLGVGTGFCVKAEEQYYLITNWHNVTGRNPESNDPLSSNGLCDPDKMKIWFYTNKIGTWAPKTITLKNEDGTPRWIEHQNGRQIDVVAIPFQKTDDIFIRELDLNTANLEIVLYPSKSVSIIGYPNGLTSGGKFSIWKTGHIASDVDLNYNGKPVFLIDATTRSGMSGSPVVLRSTGMTQFKDGNRIGTHTKFLGVYSGRIDGTSEIGRVWKPNVVNEILLNAANSNLLPGVELN
ncbi:S1 family peptidase [Tenacibaculum sp. nBUS_03]|uniref:S1 family peptidase n=1 Tax=Tenacibaculum sp. nBUS_03 TaxID=3395320 RepID=UPI003EBD7FEB